MAEPADPHEPRSARTRYSDELEQLRLQVELMGVRVDENLERMREVLRSGSTDLAAEAMAADDEVDSMNLSLIERCYEILAREQPVAGDLRLIVSSIKVTNELERVGDLALRVVKVGPRLQGTSNDSLDLVQVMADESIERFRLALRAWATSDFLVAEEVATGLPALEMYQRQLIRRLRSTTGGDSVSDALDLFKVGLSLDRIADHAAVIGSRVRYLITGEARFLAAEVRP